MSIFKLAVIIKNPKNGDEFLVSQQARPPKFGDEEYDSYLDSDLWDLPSAHLNPVEGDSLSDVEVLGAELCPKSVDLRKFDLSLALNQLCEQVVFGGSVGGTFTFRNYAEEPDFGPGPSIHTVFVAVEFAVNNGVKAGCQWVTKKHCLNWLLEVKPGNDRIGPLVVIGLLHDSAKSMKQDFLNTLSSQEYPPGVVLVPMQSRTAKPFGTTNLVVIAPEAAQSNDVCGHFVASGDALIVDPGCHSKVHEQLEDILAALPRKLIIFVTHHHHDHVDGLSVVQRCNLDAILLAHENTMRRIRRGTWSLGYTVISGDEEIYVGGKRLRVVFAPGHTDGHMGLLHIETHSLILGDHCVGQGSAVLDPYSGGNMADYFQTTYKFMELSPHILIPMHGRVNLWPKHLLSRYLKNRRNRESSVLKAIENGAQTIFDVVAMIYADVDHSHWIHAAANVRLHVEHLALQNKLPEDFSIQRFRRTWPMLFLIKWSWYYLRSYVPSKVAKLARRELLAAIVIACFAVICCAKIVLIPA